MCTQFIFELNPLTVVTISLGSITAPLTWIHWLRRPTLDAGPAGPEYRAPDSSSPGEVVEASVKAPMTSDVLEVQLLCRVERKGR